ncbi:MAG: DUF2914 domain-containing protein [Methylococcaceae bacterium]|nr:DUF2914 domain-containing protein [Methylococcaceae bacterium]
MTGQARIIKRTNGTADTENIQTKSIQQALDKWSLLTSVIGAVILLSIVLVPIYILNVDSYEIEQEESFGFQKEVSQDLHSETKTVAKTIDGVQNDQFSKSIENNTFKYKETVIPKPEPKLAFEESSYLQKEVNQDLDSETKTVVKTTDEVQNNQSSKSIENNTLKYKETVIPKPEPKLAFEESFYLQKEVNQDLDSEIKKVNEAIDEVQDIRSSNPIEKNPFKTEENVIPEPKPVTVDSLNQKKDIKQVIAESSNTPFVNMDEMARKFKAGKTIDKNENKEKKTIKPRLTAEGYLNQKKDIKQVIEDSMTKSSAKPKPVDNNNNVPKETFTRESFDKIYLDYNNDKKTQPLSKDNNGRDLPLIKRNNKTIKSSQEYSETTDKTIISRALLTNALIDREPVDNIISFVKVSRQKDTKINYFTEIINMNGKVLYHQWLWEGQMEFNKKISIKGPRWRVSTKKFIPFSKPGTWLAKLVNEEGTVLNEIKFEVIQK